MSHIQTWYITRLQLFLMSDSLSSRDGFTGGGGVRGVRFFMIKQKIIRGKMRYSNLSNNMMINEL